MKVIRITLFLLVVGFALASLENVASAEKQVIAKPPVTHRSHSNHYYRPNYGYHRGFYSPFYRPYFYSPYSYPYGFGLGLGYGYGYGYGYPSYGYGGYSGYSGYYGGYGEVRTEVKPKEAKVYVDGYYAGEVDSFDGWWQRMDIEPGAHRIVFRAPGYRPYAVTLRVLPGQNYHIKQQLQPGDDTIPDSEMRLPDRDYDRNHDRNDRTYRDRNDNDRYQDRSYNQDLKPEYNPNEDQNRDYDRNQEPYQSENPNDQQSQNDKHPLVLQVEPSDATVYVDGEYYGTADVNRSGEVQVLLPDGVHRIEVVRPGYESYSKEINVNGQYNQERIVISLKKK